MQHNGTTHFDCSVTERTWDVLIVGAGPAGSTAAAMLAPMGHSVLLLDRHSFPREKVCGDGLIPDALNSLRSLGLYDQVKQTGHSVDHLTVVSPSGIHIEIPAECITLKREKLDAMILDRAITRGSTFATAQIERVQQEDHDGVTAVVARTGELIHARMAVIATGANVSLLEPLGMVTRQKANGMATRCYVTSPVEIDRLIVSFEKEAAPGYGWIFPMGAGEYNVGCGIFYQGERPAKVNLRQIFKSFAAAKVARTLMTKADSVTPLRGARLRAGLGGAAPFNGGNVVSIGETVGATYPFTGEGIGKAMETAILAARQLHLALERGDAEPLRQLPAMVDEQLSPRYFGYHVAQRWISKPWLTDLLAARIRKSPRLTRAAAGIINETTDPRAVFAWRTLLPDWMRLPRRG